MRCTYCGAWMKEDEFMWVCDNIYTCPRYNALSKAEMKRWMSLYVPSR
jgi:hypothetical protein